MPQGKGTYGKKVGRPKAEMKQNNKGYKKRVAKASATMGAQVAALAYEKDRVKAHRKAQRSAKTAKKK